MPKPISALLSQVLHISKALLISLHFNLDHYNSSKIATDPKKHLGFNHHSNFDFVSVSG